MTLVAVVELPEGSYDAAGDDPWQPEWPPHPARLFCALLASGQDPDDLRALRWLEAQGPPRVHADPELLDRTCEQSFVVTNRVESTGRHQTHAGRRAVERIRTGCVPRTSRFAFSWSSAEPDPDVLATIVLLAKRVPYVGRSTSPAIVTLGTLPDEPAWVVWEPLPAAEVMTAQLMLRAPWPGYTDALLWAHEQGDRAREVARERPYRLTLTAPDGRSQPVVAAPHDSLLVLGLPAGVSVPGEHAGALTAALRRSLMDRVPNPLPPTLSGHDADGRTHLGFVALLDVAHAYARGHALGVGLALPRDDRDVRVAVGRVLEQAERPLTVTLPSGIEIEMEAGALSRTSDQLRPQTWTWPSRAWATVTPLVLDRFPKGDPEDEVVRGCVALGLPPVADLLLSPTPLVSGAPRVLRRHLPRQDNRPMMHARIVFSEPVAGPLLLGAQRYLGMGLCRPVRDPR